MTIDPDIREKVSKFHCMRKQIAMAIQEERNKLMKSLTQSDEDWRVIWRDERAKSQRYREALEKISNEEYKRQEYGHRCGYRVRWEAVQSIAKEALKAGEL